MAFFWLALAATIGLNLLMFIPAYIYKTDKLTDLSYSISFILIAIFGFWYSQKTAGHLLLLGMVTVWGLRLGGFLFLRIARNKKDSRFDGIREDFGRFLRFWFFQGLSVFVVLAAALATWNTALVNLSILSYVGFWLFGLGLALEAISDWQKYRFSQTNKKGTWIDRGFWRISRHPNYLGEIMVWTGVYLFCIPSLGAAGRLLALASPLYIASILLFFSGVPLVEKFADKKWGTDKDYQAYKKAVPVLVPSLSSLRRLK